MTLQVEAMLYVILVGEVTVGVITRLTSTLNITASENFTLIIEINVKRGQYPRIKLT